MNILVERNIHHAGAETWEAERDTKYIESRRFHTGVVPAERHNVAVFIANNTNNNFKNIDAHDVFTYYHGRKPTAVGSLLWGCVLCQGFHRINKPPNYGILCEIMASHPSNRVLDACRIYAKAH